MIDIHCHVLPMLDDGPQNETDMWAMLDMANAEGIDYILATPHHRSGPYRNEGKKILDAVTHYNKLIAERGYEVRLMAGQEIRIHRDLDESLGNGEAIPLNGTNYVLVEFPSDSVPDYTESLFHYLHLEGWIPVIAHPERNKAIIKDPSILYRLVTMGAIGQVTAGSLTGAFGRKIKKLSFQLLEHHLIHIVASDAHNTGNRPFLLKKAFDEIEKKYGDDVAKEWKSRSEDILAGLPFAQDPPQEPVIKKFLGFL